MRDKGGGGSTILKTITYELKLMSTFKPDWGLSQFT